MFNYRFNSIIERSNMSLDRDPEQADVGYAKSGRTSPFMSSTARYAVSNPGIPPPSPMSSLRRSSTSDTGKSSLLRHSSINDVPYAQPYTNSLRRSSTHERQPHLDYSRSNSLSRNESYHNGSISDNPLASFHSETPNYSRYSSLLDDKHDWGFRTLKRRNSKAGSKMFLNDDIKF